MFTRTRLLWIATGALGLALLPFSVDAARTVTTANSYTPNVVTIDEQVSAHRPIEVSVAQPVVDVKPAAIAAVRSYLEDATGSAAFDVEVEALEGGVARLYIAPQGDLDPAWAFARQEGSEWTVVSVGTFFDEEFYQAEGIPASLWIK
jgi:hypothetical protein